MLVLARHHRCSTWVGTFSTSAPAVACSEHLWSNRQQHSWQNAINTSLSMSDRCTMLMMYSIINNFWQYRSKIIIPWNIIRKNKQNILHYIGLPNQRVRQPLNQSTTLTYLHYYARVTCTRYLSDVCWREIISKTNRSTGAPVASRMTNTMRSTCDDSIMLFRLSINCRMYCFTSGWTQI